MFCAKCGNQLADGAKFCPSCGAPVNAAPQQYQQPQYQQPQQQYQQSQQARMSGGQSRVRPTAAPRAAATGAVKKAGGGFLKKLIVAALVVAVGGTAVSHFLGNSGGDNPGGGGGGPAPGTPNVISTGGGNDGDGGAPLAAGFELGELEGRWVSNDGQRQLDICGMAPDNVIWWTPDGSWQSIMGFDFDRSAGRVTIRATDTMPEKALTLEIVDQTHIRIVEEDVVLEKMGTLHVFSIFNNGSVFTVKFTNGHRVWTEPCVKIEANPNEGYGDEIKQKIHFDIHRDEFDDVLFTFENTGFVYTGDTPYEPPHCILYDADGKELNRYSANGYALQTRGLIPMNYNGYTVSTMLESVYRLMNERDRDDYPDLAPGEELCYDNVTPASIELYAKCHSVSQLPTAGFSSWFVICMNVLDY